MWPPRWADWADPFPDTRDPTPVPGTGVFSSVPGADFPGFSLAPRARPCNIHRENAEASLTDRLALALGLILLGILIADQIWFGGMLLLFLARKLYALSDYIAFWR